MADGPNISDIRFVGPVSGRYNLLNESTSEPGPVYACRTHSLSPQIVAIAAPVIGSRGQGVTLLLDHIGFLKGTIRHTGTGTFQVEIAATPTARAKLASRIDWLKRHRLRQTADKRAAARKLPRRPATEFYVGGDAHNGFVVDYSETGAGISAKVRPPLGTAIEIGDLPAVVVRHMDVGFAVQFGAGLALDSIESHLGQRRGAPAA